MTTTPEQVSAWITAGVMAFAAGFERVRNLRTTKKHQANNELLSDAKAYKARGDAMVSLADEWKARWDAEHKESVEYHAWVHTKAQEDQKVLTAAQLKIVELQARPDFSDLFQHLKKQSDVSVQILKGIESMLGMMSKILERDSVLKIQQKDNS